jgi:hypothetical protein
MRPLLMAFLILSPFIALAQNYHLHAIHSFTHAPDLAQAMVTNASTKMGDMMHKVQALLS